MRFKKKFEAPKFSQWIEQVTDEDQKKELEDIYEKVFHWKKDGKTPPFLELRFDTVKGTAEVVYPVKKEGT